MSPARTARRALALSLATALACAALTTGVQAGASVSSPGAPRLSQSSPWPADAVAGSLLVTTVDAATGQTLPGVIARLGERIRLVHVAPGTEAAVAAALRTRPGVLAVEPDHLRSYADEEPDDPAYQDQWAHQATEVEQAWELTTGSPRVRVAVIDSGIRGDHPDLRENVVEQVDVADATVAQTAPDGGVDNDTCDLGHGTWVAGVLGAVGDNNVGVAGAAWRVAMIDVAVSSNRDGDHCAITDSAVLEGLRYATEHPDGPVDVVNLSLGGTSSSCPRAYQTAIDSARDAGAVLVSVAGNEGDAGTNVPASCDGVISVGATGRDGALAPYSNRNAYVDLVAPGGSAAVADGLVLTTHAGDVPCPQPEGPGLCGRQGTSYAAPYVAGVAVLLRSVRPDITPDQVESVLEATATHPDGDGARDTEFGWGIVRAGAAVEMVEEGESLPPRQADLSFPVGLARVSAATGQTEAVAQAVAVSQTLFPDGAAPHVVLARRDDFADALAGSSLAGGSAPILFTSRDGPLEPSTGGELRRVLAQGARVFLLGGTAALPGSLDDELASLGYRPIRLAGASREETARLVGEQVRALPPELRHPGPSAALLATRGNWPDAVSAGGIGASFGVPILLTPADALHPEAAAALRAWKPDVVYVVGGEGVVSPSVLRAAAAAAGGEARRLGGAERFQTAVAVAQAMEELMAAEGRSPALAVVVNLRRADAFAHVLSGSALVAGGGGVYLGVEDDGGTTVPGPTRDYAPTLATRGVIVGDVDLVSPAASDQVEDLLLGG